MVRRFVPANVRWRALAIVAAVLVYAGLLQGVRPLYSPDEGRYVDVALAMLADGDFVHPKVHHEFEHWSKPPLTYWAIAAAMKLFGHREFATRLPSALAFAGTILLLGRLGRRFVPARPWLPASIYATFALPSIGANLVTTDSLLAFCECLVVVGFADAWWHEDADRRRRGRWLMAFAAALAFMTKGPPGLLTLVACFAFAVASDGVRGARRLFDPVGVVLFALVGLGWYAYVVIESPQVLRYFLVEEVVNRVATDKMHRNAEWYGAIKVYLPTLVLGALPWLPFAVFARWRTRAAADAGARTSPERRFLLCWLLLPLAVFAIAKSRLPLYLLPVFAPLALIAARALGDARITRPRLAGIALWATALVAARALPAWLDVDNDDRRLAYALIGELESTPDEIAFVETAPRLGLRFYLGSEIERISLPDGTPRPESQDIDGELREREGCRLLMSDAGEGDTLARALAARGVPFRRRADVRGYALFMEATPECEWAPHGGRPTAR